MGAPAGSFAHRAAPGLALLTALACTLSAAACGQEQFAAEAEARARRWGIPAAEIVHNVVYAEYGQRRLMLDLYLPPNRDPAVALPAVIAVRGGGWQAGDKEFFGYIAGQLAMQGFASASIQYRTAKEVKFPAAVQDVKAAVRWMRAHGGEYGVDPDAIGAIGGSAGAHLVAMLATTGGMKELEGDGGNPSVSSDVQAVVAMGGAYDLRVKDGVGPEFIEGVRDFIGEPFDANVAAASPLTHVSRRSAPLLLLHSPSDPLAPYQQAVDMERRYRREGASATLVPIDAPMHGFWGSPRYFPETSKRFVEFFRKTLQVRKTRAPQPLPVTRHVDDTWLEGSVAGAAVRVFFGPAGWPLEEGTLWGAYFYTREWALIPLEGHREPSGAIVLYEGDPGTPRDRRARFELNLAQRPIVSGTWATADRTRTARVQLRTIAQPPPFEKAIARPRTFDDPHWPFTFIYPNGWSLKVTESTLLLQSADPFDMLFDNRLECQRGEGLPPRPDAGARPFEFHGAFFLGHEGWVVPTANSINQSCDEEGSECTAPETRSSGGAVFMSSSIGYRSHNPWGYAGMADAANYLVVDGNRWAFCVDRALDSPDRIVLRASKRR